MCSEPCRLHQANEPTGSTFDSQQFEQDLYAAMNGNDGTRPISVDAGVGASPNHYPNMTYANFNLVPHYLDGFGHYGEQLWSGTGRPLGDGEYIWPACNTKQGFEWFATSTAAKRGKDASDLRLSLPETPSAQVTRHARIRAGCRRAGPVFGCRGA